MNKVLCVSTNCKHNKDNICSIGEKIEYKNVLMLEEWYMSYRTCKYFNCRKKNIEVRVWKHYVF